MSSPHVLIIGAGIGGLTLAQGLKKNGIAFTVFERDPTPHSRSQGYRIRINPNGAASLRATLSDEAFSLFERTCAQYNLGGARFDLATGEPSIYQVGKDFMGDTKTDNKYNVDRAVLRAALIKGIEENIQFGKAFKSYSDEIDGGKIKAEFADGTIVEGDLLVGADGTNSKVRQQFIPGFQMVDTGTRSVYGKTPITKELKSRYPQKAMDFMTFSSHPTTPLKLFLEPVIFSQQPAETLGGSIPEVRDYVYWVLICPTVESLSIDDAEFRSMSGQQLADYSVKMVENAKWHESIRALIELQDAEAAGAIRVTSSLPPLKEWETKGNLTLLGDAIHPMSPTGGVGANTAIADAGDLCQAIVNAGDGGLKDLIAKYEGTIRSRGDTAINGSFMGAKHMYGQKPYSECELI